MKTRSKEIGKSSRRRAKASTSEIVPTPETNHNVPKKWKTQFHRLIELRDHLLRERGELNQDTREIYPNYSLHMADAATDNFDRDFALSLLSSEQNSIYEIEQALDRIRHGTYGLCEMTGQPISIERLSAIPWTRFSSTAERELEENGTISKTKLAAARNISRTETAEEEEEEI